MDIYQARGELGALWVNGVILNILDIGIVTSPLNVPAQLLLKSFCAKLWLQSN